MKTKKYLTLLIIGICIVLFSGCRSVSSIRDVSLSEGPSQVFNADYNKVLKVIPEAISESGISIEETKQIDDKTYMIIGEKSADAFQWGSVVRVIIEKTSKNKTTVRVYTQKKQALNITARGDFSKAIFSNIELKLR